MKKLHYLLTVSLLVLFTIEANAQMTHIPDANFRQALVDLGYGAGIVGENIPSANINGITTLNVSEKNIADLTGIEDFVALKNLNCGTNKLATLDLSRNLALEELIAYTNQLTTIDLSQNRALIELYLEGNQLTKLDVSKNTALTKLFCSFNKLTSLDVSKNTALEELWCVNNDLKSLDVSKNTSLIGLKCSDNQLSKLDIRNGNNENIDAPDLNNNPNLTCIYVDNKNASYLTSWLKDDAAKFLNNESESDYTYIPDDNFLQAIKNEGYGTGVVGNNVPKTNINVVTYLDASGMEIKDLTGIAGFTSLQTLRCNDNALTTLDLSANLNLKKLYCAKNWISNLDLSTNNLLTYLDCYGNKLPSLDLSEKTALTVVICGSNQLTTIDIRNGNNANITNFDATNNLNLSCIYVDDKTVGYLEFWKKDAIASFVNNEDECSPQTYVPDDNFEQALIDLGYDTGSLDNYVPTDSISGIKKLDVREKNIADLTGIESFTALITLFCQTNNLSSLNVSKNTGLTLLACSGNELTGIDISKNTALVAFNCDHNKLTNIDVTNNKELESFKCDSNNIESLDLSKNTKLVTLYCGNNLLKSIDLSNNLAVSSVHIETNQLKHIDVSKNTALKYFDCTENQFSSLDLSKNTHLATLICDGNDLSVLDVSKNTVLIRLYCSNNQLTSLDIRNDNNAKIQTFDATNNPDLTCIYVDDKTVGYLTFWKKDAIASFVNNEDECSPQTYVPDDNFEQALIDLGYDTGSLDNYVPTDSISGIKKLDVREKNIADLTGIESFTALITLFCQTNNLSSLNVSKNTALEEFYCYENNITSLDLSKNPDLIILSCGRNSKLTVLDVSKNPALERFLCYENNITSLDVSKNTKLALLWCEDNKLTTLDVSKNTKLTELTCYNNQLTSLDVRNGNNANFTTFQALNNPNLSCIYVNDKTADLSAWTKDATATFVNNEEDCDALTSVDDIKMQTISIYPNPTNGIVNFDFAGEPIQKMKMVNIAGKTVFQKENISETETIDISGFANGLYIVILQTDNGSNSFKISKK